MELIKLKKKIAIIGAGWFGCHIAYQLKKLNTFDIKLYEKEKDIFLGASSHNQNRLHLGFHYPRSKQTRLQSKNGFDKFLKLYYFLTKKIKYNIYGISDSPETLLDYHTFLQIMKSEKLKFKEINSYEKFKILGLSGSILTDERFHYSFSQISISNISSWIGIVWKIKFISNFFKINQSVNIIGCYVIISTKICLAGIKSIHPLIILLNERYKISIA